MIPRRSLVLFLFALLLPAWKACSETPREIARKTFPSVVILLMEDEKGQPVSIGSGFFVKDNLLATNLHVLEGAVGGYAKLIGAKDRFKLSGVANVDFTNDLVLLTVEERKGTPLPLGDDSQTQVGDEIFAVGNPQGLEGTFSQGIVSGIRRYGNETVLQITAPISPGSSGGPVLDSEARVIGVAVATFKGGQNLNFAIPVSSLRKLINDAGPTKPFSKVLKPARELSLLEQIGEKPTSGIEGENFMWDVREEEASGTMRGSYTFSLSNKLHQPVRNILCLVIFYDSNGQPLDVEVVKMPGLIPPNLAKRVSGAVDPSVQRLTTNKWTVTPNNRVEFRILNFEVAQGFE